MISTFLSSLDLIITIIIILIINNNNKKKKNLAHKKCAAQVASPAFAPKRAEMVNLFVSSSLRGGWGGDGGRVNPKP